MDPLSPSQVFPVEDQTLNCCKVISGIVATVSAVAAAIFAISTYCIMTYGAPLAVVAFVANPLVSAAIAGAATLVFIIAISTKSTHTIIVKSEKAANSTVKPEKKPHDIQNPEVEIENKSVKVKIKNPELDQEPKVTILINEPQPQPTVTIEKKINTFNVSLVLSGFSETTPENERMEALAKVPLEEIQKYIEEKEYASRNEVKQIYLIPPAILSQLDASKFTNDQVCWLCFGHNERYMELMHPLKATDTDGLADRQARFEALIGNDNVQLKRFEYPIISPFFSASQLAHLRSTFDGDFNAHYCTPDKLSHFFPRYDLTKDTKETLLKGERERFAKFFDVKNVQFMLEKGGALALPGSLATDPLKERECSNFRYNWKYYLQLIPCESVKSIDFSLIQTEGGKSFRFSPFQLIFMLRDFDKSQLQALTPEQIDHIKEIYDLIHKIFHGNNDNTTKVKNFLSTYWDDYLFSLNKIYTEEEFNQMKMTILSMKKDLLM